MEAPQKSDVSYAANCTGLSLKRRMLCCLLPSSIYAAWLQAGCTMLKY